MPFQDPILLGERLVKKRLISREALERSLEEQKKTGETLGRILTRTGLLREEDLFLTLAEHFEMSFIELAGIVIDPGLKNKIPAKIVCHYRVFPLELRSNTLTVAMSDPLEVRIIDDLSSMFSCDVRPVLARESDILEAIRRNYGVGAELLDAIDGKKNETVYSSRVEDTEDKSGDASIVRFVNQLLSRAVKERATDIHIEPYEDELKIRYRVDGVLYDVPIHENARAFHSAIISRIKVMAGLDLSEKRLPQDGRVKARIENENYDLRVSVLPTAFGESIDIRILSNKLLFRLEDLGILKPDLDMLERLIHRSYGIIFVTGPTGSGKTTTLYSCLSRINRPDRKIITIEDPIEYQLKGITQVQVNPRIGLTFATGLRTMLRHDPDIMMVGEARDRETVETTIRIALTGHLVFSTMHTNDAAGSVARLMDMGVEPYLITSSVLCFVAQRLVRLVCPYCKKKRDVPEEILEEFEIYNRNTDEVCFYEGSGCEYCRFTGYMGRTGIYEFLVIDDKTRELIIKRASTEAIRKEAVSRGMRTLRMDGWQKIKKGLTTVEEVMRVTEKE